MTSLLGEVGTSVAAATKPKAKATEARRAFTGFHVNCARVGPKRCAEHAVARAQQQRHRATHRRHGPLPGVHVNECEVGHATCAPWRASAKGGAWWRLKRLGGGGDSVRR